MLQCNYNIADYGWCLDENGDDQNVGTVSITPIPNSFTAMDCLMECLNSTGVKGCEYNVNRGCAYHTQPVSRGNGNEGYWCWTLNNGMICRAPVFFVEL